MDTLWILVELVASLLLFLEFKRILKVIRVCRLNDLKCTGSYVQATAMFLVSALLILGFYADLERASRHWGLAPPGGVPPTLARDHPTQAAHGALANTDWPSTATAPREGVVARVIDGDTILLESGDRVAYMGVDAPEIVHPRKPVEPLGRKAYRLNRELVEGKQVKLDFDKRDRDRYNRILAYVFTGDVFVNAALVRSGLARLTNRTSGAKYALQLGEAEHQARQENRGLWALP